MGSPSHVQVLTTLPQLSLPREFNKLTFRITVPFLVTPLSLSPRPTTLTKHYSRRQCWQRSKLRRLLDFVPSRTGSLPNPHNDHSTYTDPSANYNDPLS